MNEIKIFNRKGKRAYEKRVKHSKNVYFCPQCKMDTVHEKVPSRSYVWKKDMQCELCGNRSIQGIQ